MIFENGAPDVARDLPEKGTGDGVVDPYPVSQGSHLRLNLTHGQHVRVAIFNAQGAEIRVVADEFLSAGRHDIPIDAAALPSGVYAHRLVGSDLRESGTFAAVK